MGQAAPLDVRGDPADGVRARDGGTLHAPDPRRRLDEELAALHDDVDHLDVDVGERADRPAAARSGRVDGRKRRWRQHKIDRREELVDGTLVLARPSREYAAIYDADADIEFEVHLPDEYAEEPGEPVYATVSEVPFQESVNPSAREQAKLNASRVDE